MPSAYAGVKNSLGVTKIIMIIIYYDENTRTTIKRTRKYKL